jgi:hypothetical protein
VAHAANAVWFTSNGIVFEGATADGFELTIQPVDPTADYTALFPDMDANWSFVASTLTTNAQGVANSVWGASNSLVFEGATANDFEGSLTVTDPTADRTYTFPNYTGTVAMTTFANLGTWSIADAGSATSLTMRDVPAAGTANDLFELDVTPTAMDDMSDTFRYFYIDINGTANHTAGNFIAFEIDNNNNDAQSRDVGFKVDADFDAGVQVASRVLVRESFEQPFIVLEEDFTAKVLTDNGIMTVLGSPSGIVEYYEEALKTASSWVIADGDLDISADDGAGDNEGFELMLGDDDDATSGWLVAQTDTLCFTVNATTTLIAGTDQFVIGWRTSEAFQDTGAVANYTTFAYVGQTNIDGSVFMFVDDGDSANDDSGVNIANASTNTYKVCMEADGGAAAYLNGTEITNTNTTGQLIASGTNMVPFISYLCVAGTDAGILIHYWEITGN